jgi:hypothetical protein
MGSDILCEVENSTQLLIIVNEGHLYPHPRQSLGKGYPWSRLVGEVGREELEFRTCFAESLCFGGIGTQQPDEGISWWHDWALWGAEETMELAAAGRA